VPIAEPSELSTNISNILATLFLRQPKAVEVSLRKSLKSLTVGLRINNSIAAVTIPAPMVGFSEVIGAAMNAVMIVNICAPAIAAPSADKLPLMMTHCHIKLQPRSGPF